MKLRIVGVGKPRDKLLGDLCARYLERLARLAPTAVSHVAEATGAGRTPDEARRIEAARLREVLVRAERGSRPGALIALDERGDELSSVEMARWLGGLRDRGVGSAAFLIGGDEGLCPELRGEAARVLSLSRMTFTHEMARVLLAEQLYRAHAILAGHPYHRE